MVVLLRFGYRKDDLDIRIESFELILLIVPGRFEVNSVKTGLQGLCLRQQMEATAVRVSDGIVKRRPSPIRHGVECDRNSCGRATERYVENVC